MAARNTVLSNRRRSVPVRVAGGECAEVFGRLSATPLQQQRLTAFALLCVSATRSDDEVLNPWGAKELREGWPWPRAALGGGGGAEQSEWRSHVS